MEIARRVRKFLFNVLFIPHFSYLLLPFYRPQKRRFKNTKKDKLSRRGKSADLKKLSKLRIRNREVIYALQETFEIRRIGDLELNI